MKHVFRRTVAWLLLVLLFLGQWAQGAALKLFINLDAKSPEEALVESFFSRNSPAKIVYTRDDLRSVELHFLQEDESDPQRPFRYVDPSGWSAVKFAAGTPDLIPTGGTFTITDVAGAQTTGSIAYNASASTVQTAVRAALTTNFSSAVVADVTAGVWTIDRVTTGAFATDITITGTALTPSGSTGYVINTEEGTASLSDKWQIGLARAHPILRTSGWSALPSASVAVTTVQVGSASANKVFRVRYNTDAFGGAVVLSFTGDTTTGSVTWAYNASSDEVVTAFEAHTDVEDDGVRVVRNGAGDYTIELVGAGIAASNTPALAISSNTLEVPVGLTASLSSNTALVTTLLGSAETADVSTEVEIQRTASTPETVLHVDSQLARDLIRNTPGSSTGLEIWATTHDIPKVAGDSSELAALDPDFEGQLLLLQDEQLNLYRSNGTSPGDWTSTFGVTTLLSQNFATSGLRTAIATKTADYTATTSDHTLIFTVAVDKTLSLPAAASHTGRIYIVKNVAASAGNVIIDPNGAELIDGASTVTLSPGFSWTIQDDGTGWHLITQSSF